PHRGRRRVARCPPGQLVQPEVVAGAVGGGHYELLVTLDTVGAVGLAEVLHSLVRVVLRVVGTVGVLDQDVGVATQGQRQGVVGRPAVDLRVGGAGRVLVAG